MCAGGVKSLQHIHHFLDAGVDLYVGTDDPGFLGNRFEDEVAWVRNIVAQHASRASQD